MSTLPAAQVPLWAPLYGANPVDAVQRYFRKYAVFTGRASRSEYWWIALANAVVLVVLYPLTILGFLVGAGDGSSGPGPLWPLGLVGVVLLGAWFLGTIVPGIALTVRRFHDANLSGLLVLLGLVPYVGVLIVVIMSVLPSNVLGRRFDAPNGVPVWSSGMPYAAFPPAPGEPDRPMPPMPGAYAAPGTYPPPYQGSPYAAPQYGPPQYGAPQYGPPQYGQPPATPPVVPAPVAPPPAVAPPPHDPGADHGGGHWTPPTGS